ncbi:MAG: sugar ABC transporter permease [Clostridia bacterium]|jgi:multiple sugar transport system permease protein|nr:sugar ABC transporter permease [Clostridia bacterium]
MMGKNKIGKRSGIYSKSENIAFHLIMMPFMIFFLLFNILPVLSSVVLSFFDYDMVSNPIFTGLENYSRMFTADDTFLKVLGNTLRFSIIAGPGSFILAFLLAWMINEFSRTVRVILTFIFYAPALVGNAYFIWQIFFSGDSLGYLNNFLISFGFITEPINWFQNTQYNMTILLIIQLWMSMGVSFLANIAGLQNVSSEMYEAGAIDGIRTRWHELWYITLPSMKTILLFGAVMQIQSVFSVSGLMTTLVGYPSVNNSVDTLVSYISDIGTARYEMGYAAALSVVLFLLVLAFRFGIGALLNLIGKSDS